MYESRLIPGQLLTPSEALLENELILREWAFHRLLDREEAEYYDARRRARATALASGKPFIGPTMPLRMRYARNLKRLRTLFLNKRILELDAVRRARQVSTTEAA